MTDASVRREDLISRRAAAELLGIHANTLDRAAKQAGLRKYKVLGDNRIFYRRDEIGGIDIFVEVEDEDGEDA